MVGVLHTVGSTAASVVAEVDPTVQPVRQSFYAFVFLAVLTVLLLISMIKQLRKVRTGLEREHPAPPPIPVAGEPEASTAERGSGERR